MASPPLGGILLIYLQIPADLQTKIFERGLGDPRKCIVATNVTETFLA